MSYLRSPSGPSSKTKGPERITKKTAHKEAVNIGKGHLRTENHGPPKADGRVSVASGRGRPRKNKQPGVEGWNVGRYPFMRDAMAYLRAMKDVFEPSTYVEAERRLRRMNKDLMSLRESGTIKNIAAYALTEEDILAYLKLLRDRGVHDSGVCHNVDTLSGVMDFIGNKSMERAKAKYRQHFPTRSSKRYDPISTGDRQKIIGCANKVPDQDWMLMEAYGLTVTAICTGLRPKELRLANIPDLDLTKEILYTEHVKAENSYGNARFTAIHPDGLTFLKRYVKVREEILAKQGLSCEALFPAIQDIRKKGDGYFAPNSLTKLRARVTADSGVTFDLRACRRTFGQENINMGVPLDAVSRMMGHATTTTTEKYYCRKPNEMAIAEAQQIYRSQSPPRTPSVFRPDRKRRISENFFRLTG